MSESVQTRCLYHINEQGIHEFIMLEFSRAGSDAFVEALELMNSRMSPDIPRPMLVDSSRGVQPLNYLFSRLRHVERGTGGGGRTRLALLLQPGIMTGIVGGMMRMFANLNVRIFSPEDREAAVCWLLEN